MTEMFPDVVERVDSENDRMVRKIKQLKKVEAIAKHFVKAYEGRVYQLGYGTAARTHARLSALFQGDSDE